MRPRPTTVIGAVAATLALYACVQMARAARIEWRDFHPPRHAIARPDDAAADLSEVAFQSLDGSELRGWWLPSRNGAAMVFVHGSSGDRRDLYPQALLLHQQGVGALLFDMPGHGESAGTVQWSNEARGAVRAALRFAGAQSGVSSVGAYGFSMGAYTVAQVAGDGAQVAGDGARSAGDAAARNPGVPAFIVLDGVPSDGDELTRLQYGRLGPFTSLAAVWTDRLCGFRAAPLPLATIARYSGPLLFIIGEGDAIVPAAMQEAVAHAAPRAPSICRAPSGHGDWLAQSNTCRAALRSFLQEQTTSGHRAEAR
ncbi:MAG TPA: alpha/beta fold hydrolase [Myxococcales bacterium]